jgi:MoxR-like ATPase
MAAPANVTVAQICIQARVPVFLWGGPGTGKTAALEQFAAKLDEPLWTVILSIREPSDQGGLPVITEEGVKMHPPRWAMQLKKTGHGIIFWDEFNTAPPTTQSSALRVVHGGWAGDEQLPEDTAHVAAGNPPEISTGAYDLTSAIANRWVHIKWPVAPAEWANGMVAGFPAAGVSQVRADWKDGIPAKHALVASFIRKRGELLYQMPESATKQGRAWPSPRTWTMAGTLLAAAESAGHDTKSEVARLLVGGCVGEGAQIEFSKWYVNLDLRDPEEYLADPAGTPLPTRQDQTMATLDSVAGAALNQNKLKHERIERYYAAWKVLGRIVKAGTSDVAIPAARTLAGNMPEDIDRNLPEETLWILPILHKAGIDFSQAV